MQYHLDAWQPTIPIFPMHRLIAVFDQATTAAHAALLLHDAGFERGDILVYHGRDGLTRMREGAEYSTFMQFSLALQDRTADETAGRADYERALAEGKSVVLVYCPGEDRRLRAQAILQAAGGYQMAYSCAGHAAPHCARLAHTQKRSHSPTRVGPLFFVHRAGAS
jgi:hypothetical protein